MDRIHKFSDATLNYLGSGFYVYTLSDQKNNVFYVGKGKGNRVFSHELETTFFSGKDLRDKQKRILELGDKVVRRIIARDLTEEQAFAAELALIEFLNLSNLSNLVSGHGSKGGLVEELEYQYGYEKMSVSDIKTDSLILAVKIRNAFDLSLDESRNYSWIDGTNDDGNLKSRTLGYWKISLGKAQRVNYIIGINTSANNSVVSAYEVATFETDGKRFGFTSNSSSQETLRELGLYKKAWTDVKFGTGSAIAYINI